MSTMDALILLVLSFPIVIWCAWSDLKTMRIPNNANIALIAVFIVMGLILLPLPEFGIRLLQGVVVLAICFVLNALGLMGGGDAKLFAAIAPYIALADTGVYFLGLALLGLASVALHRLIRATPSLLKHVADWDSFDMRKTFPFGLPLATSLSCYLLYVATRATAG